MKGHISRWVSTGLPMVAAVVLGLLSAMASGAQADPGSLPSYQETPVGFTEEGFPFRGDPNAPVTLVEYSDYLCPFCGRHFNLTLPTLLDSYVRPGKVKLVFRDFPIDQLHPTAAKGSQAALCVAEQGPVLFWKMHDVLFRRQQEWNRLPDPSEFLAQAAAEIGAEPGAYAECIASGRTVGLVQASVEAARALEFNGTPSFQFVRTATGEDYSLVGAQSVQKFAEWTDALLAGKAPPEPKKPELPFWAKPEGLAPDPERPGHTVAGDPYKGDPKAKVAVVEFADFQCPPCARHALDVQPALDEEFIKSGKVLWVVKQFPLRIHPNAPAAAAAAECAADQGRFWELHDLLFEKQDDWSKSDDADAALVSLATTLGLDIDAFKTCFNGRKAMERVLGDIFDAQGIVTTTPTFIAVYGGRGSVIRGAKSKDNFVAILNKLLESAEAQKDEAPKEPKDGK